MASTAAPARATTTPAPTKQTASPVPTKLTATNVAEFLFSDQVKRQIALALPQHLKPERMIRMAITTVRRTPKILECDPMTLVACIVQASEIGLELSGPLGQAYIIPRKNKGRMEATFQIGYRGFLRLAYNTGQVSFFNARAVRAGDLFNYSLGTNQFINHKPEAPRGAKITHFYAVLQQKDGAADCEVWSLSDMEEHRDRYRSDKFLKDQNKSYRGPWDDEFEAMGCKTMIRELSKRAPLSAELMSVAARDEYTEIGFPPVASPGELLQIEDAGTPPAQPMPAAASPDTLESIDAEMKRAGIFGNAAEEFMKTYATPNGDLTEESAQAALKELSGMPDAGGE